MSTQNYTKLKLLQALDGALLVVMLLTFATLTWLSLSDLSAKAQHNLLESTAVLEQVEKDFIGQLSREAHIDENRKTLEQLNDAFFKLAFDPGSIEESLPHLRTLGETFDAQRQVLLQEWPGNFRPLLRDSYELVSDKLVASLVQSQTLASDQWTVFAADIRTQLLATREVVEEIDSIGNSLGVLVSDSIQLSINSANRSVGQMKSQIVQIRENAVWAMLGLMILLLLSRIYFSHRFGMLTRDAQQAQQQAENAVKTKTRFLATMSHEIRTPMNGVIGMTRLLMDTPLNQRQADFVESIRLSGEHLLTVINDVLDFSRIEAGRFELKQEAFELRSCVEEILSLLHAKAVEKNLELTYAVHTAVPLFIVGDQVRLRQILTNLIGNAIKFTESGEVTVFVNQKSEAKSMRDLVGVSVHELEFEIRDTGPGIRASRLGSIFEQFSRADETLVRQHEGTGLGLSISRHLVGMMGGSIWVESRVGVGSRFFFTLQARQGTGALQAIHQASIPAISGKRILVIENNPANSQALRDYCLGWGAEVELASSVAEAVSWLASGKTYGLALLDGHVAETAAMDFAQYVRQRSQQKALPLVLMIQPNDRQEAVHVLYNALLTKPMTRSRLLDSLLAALGGQAALPESKVVVEGQKLGESLPLSVLLVEDNRINQIVATAILKQLGYQADLAENGLVAVAAMHKKAYDVVFMDMQMPEMDGVQATRCIRAELPPERQPVIIAMTANALESDRQECVAAGMNDYTSKPVLPETVKALLEKWGAGRVAHTRTAPSGSGLPNAYLPVA